MKLKRQVGYVSMPVYTFYCFFRINQMRICLHDEESDSHIYYDLIKIEKSYNCKEHTNIVKTGYN